MQIYFFMISLTNMSISFDENIGHWQKWSRHKVNYSIMEETLRDIVTRRAHVWYLPEQLLRDICAVWLFLFSPEPWVLDTHLWHPARLGNHPMASCFPFHACNIKLQGYNGSVFFNFWYCRKSLSRIFGYIKYSIDKIHDDFSIHNGKCVINFKSQ